MPRKSMLLLALIPALAACGSTSSSRPKAVPMPFIMPPETAARRIVEGFASGGFEITFPRRLSWPMKLLNLLPYPAYFWLLRQASRRGGARPL